MKYGIYYAYWIQTWNDDFFPYIAKSRELGFDAIEINGGYVADISKAQLDGIKEEIAHHNLATSYCYGLSGDMDIASASREKQRKGKDRLKHIIDAIAYLEGTMLSGLIHAAWNVSLSDSAEKEKMREISLENFSVIADYAQSAGITLCIEVVNRFEQYILNTAQEGVAYIQDLGKENVKLHLDTFHMNIEEKSLEEGFYTAQEHVAHVHIGENNRTPPGGGHLDWMRILSTLHRINYEGLVVMEPFITSGTAVARDVALWRDMFRGREDKDALLKNSLAYMRHVDMLCALAKSEDAPA